MRHRIKAEFVRYETVEHSHGRESAHVVERLVCDTCGVLEDNKHYGYDRRDYPEVRLREIEHNLDVLWAKVDLHACVDPLHPQP